MQIELELELSEVALITSALQAEIGNCKKLWMQAGNQHWLDRCEKAENIYQKIMDQMGI